MRKTVLLLVAGLLGLAALTTQAVADTGPGSGPRPQFEDTGPSADPRPQFA